MSGTLYADLRGASMAWIVARGTRRIYSICWRDADGRHHSRITGTRGRRIALGLLARFRAEHGLSQPSTRVTGLDLMEAWLAYVAATRCQETADSYRSSVEPMTRAWEATPIEQWCRADVEAYAAAKRKSGDWTGRTASSGSRRAAAGSGGPSSTRSPCPTSCGLPGVEAPPPHGALPRRGPGARAARGRPRPPARGPCRAHVAGGDAPQGGLRRPGRRRGLAAAHPHRAGRRATRTGSCR